ncbi:MAG: glycosyl hydrolase family 17 protein [Nitrospira sp.]|nr:glycosyl hydrolase family 17 protein [Nitrospira sp.]
MEGLKCTAYYLLAALFLVLGGCGDSSPPPPPPPDSTSPASLTGLNFSPYVDGQDPNRGSRVTETQLRQRMGLIAPHTQWIRTFGSTNGLERAGAVAHSLGLKAAIGAWLSRDFAANELEISNLIASARAKEADLLIVGSEVLLRNDLSEADLLDYIGRVKQAVPGIQVTYADVYSELLAHPKVLEAVDVVLANFFPYWESVQVESAVASIHQQYSSVVAAANGKEVMVSETGWPSAGDAQGNARPSPENAAAFLLNFVSWAEAEGVHYFYFEAFDEAWKAAYEGPQGAHWGIWDKDGTLKAGMAEVFEGERMGDNWSVTGIPGGPGSPTINFVQIPKYGTFTDLTGQVLHVDPSAYRVAVYIYVSGWWTKPTFANPLTTIQIDGSWTADITTGGIDQNATRIAAFVVPKDYVPPLLSGDATFPSALTQAAVASREIARNP